MSRDSQGQYSDVINIPRARASRQTEDQVPRTRSQARLEPRDDDENDDAWKVEKPHTSSYRYDYPATSQRTTTMQGRPGKPKKTRVVGYRRFFLARTLVISGLLLLFLALGIMVFSAFASWWQRHNDDVTYGMPRTFQTDEYVGHGDSPDHPNHFIAVSIKGVVEVVEINTQNIKLDHAYYITSTDQLNPVTLTFPTIDGKQYMYVSIGDSSNAYTVALVNDGKEFTGAQH